MLPPCLSLPLALPFRLWCPVSSPPPFARPPTEDVALYWSFKSGGHYSVFRALEPGLRHTWHERTCDPLSAHYRDCRRSRYENYGSGTFLGEALEDAGVDLGRVIGRRGAPL